MCLFEHAGCIVRTVDRDVLLSNQVDSWGMHSQKNRQKSSRKKWRTNEYQLWKCVWHVHIKYQMLPRGSDLIMIIGSKLQNKCAEFKKRPSPASSVNVMTLLHTPQAQCDIHTNHTHSVWLPPPPIPATRPFAFCILCYFQVFKRNNVLMNRDTSNHCGK